MSSPEAGSTGRHRSSGQAPQPPLQGLLGEAQMLFRVLHSNSLDRWQWPQQVLLSPPFMAQSLRCWAVPSKALLSALPSKSRPPVVSLPSHVTPPFSAPGLVLRLLFLNPVVTGRCSDNDQELLKQLQHQADFMQDTSKLLDQYVSTWPLMASDFGLRAGVSPREDQSQSPLTQPPLSIGVGWMGKLSPLLF